MSATITFFPVGDGDMMSRIISSRGFDGSTTTPTYTCVNGGGASGGETGESGATGITSISRSGIRATGSVGAYHVPYGPRDASGIAVVNEYGG